MSLVAAGLYSPDESSYTLSAFVVSGIGVKPQTKFGSAPPPLEHTGPTTARIPNEYKISHMLGPEGLCSPDMVTQTPRLNHDAPVDELLDIATLWQSYWRKYAENMTVPVLYIAGAEDLMWDMSVQNVQAFSEAFLRSPRVETSRIPCAPHNIEMSLQRTGFWARLIGFAVESAVAAKIRERVE